MAKRLKIALLYSYNQDWIAGSYYILNLIAALNRLPDKKKPELTVLCASRREFDTVKKTGYSKLRFRKFNPKVYFESYSIWERIVNKITSMILGRRIFRKEEVLGDVLFPAIDHPFLTRIKHKLFWIPDFQERFLPHFFSEQEIQDRKKLQDVIAANSYPVLFSSRDAASHFKKFYPGSQSEKFVLNFAVSHPEYKNIPIQGLLKKYSLTKPYFFCPNQFWAHKNHKVVLEAVRIIRWEKKKHVLIVFSGKESDYRNPDFFKEIKSMVEEYKIEDCVRFLGFIERVDQLQLMKNAISLIQPSLFEGWSTSIEDAKAMNQYVIASDIGVHREQLSTNFSFFDPLVPLSLVEVIESQMEKPPMKIKWDYSSKLLEFGKQFIQIAEQAQTSGK